MKKFVITLALLVSVTGWAVYSRIESSRVPASSYVISGSMNLPEVVTQKIDGVDESNCVDVLVSALLAETDLKDWKVVSKNKTAFYFLSGGYYFKLADPSGKQFLWGKIHVRSQPGMTQTGQIENALYCRYSLFDETSVATAFYLKNENGITVVQFRGVL